MLGYAATWPQAAAALPQPAGASEFDWEGDRPLGLAMEDLVRGDGWPMWGPSHMCCMLRVGCCATLRRLC